MGLYRYPLLIFVATFLVLGAWSAFVLHTGIGAKLYLLPGTPIAEAVYPCEMPQPFRPKHAETVEEAFGELIVEILARCSLPQGILALELSAFFWLVIVPLAVFFVFRRRRALRD